MAFQLSPGVAVVEKDFSSIVPAVSSSNGAFAGLFPWGPVLDPVTVSSENVLVQRFGKPNDYNAQSFFTAANFLSYTNNLLVVRADTTSALNAVAKKSGSVTGVTVPVANSGATLPNVPTVTFSAPDDASGQTATGYATLMNNGITAVQVTNGGTGYNAANLVLTVATTGTGSGCILQPVVVNGVVTSVTVVNPGSNYTGTLSITISQGAGTGTSLAFGTISKSSQQIQSVTIVNPGYGYTNPPTVTFGGVLTGTVPTGITGSILTAGVKINNFNDYSNNYLSGQGTFGEFAAKYPGALGNSLKYATADSSNFKVVATGTVSSTQNSTSLAITSGALITQAKAGSIVRFWSGANGTGTLLGTSAIASDPTLDTAATLTTNPVILSSIASITLEWKYATEFDGAPGTSAFAAGNNTSNDEMHVIVVDALGYWTGTIGATLEKFAFVSKASDAKKSDGTNNYYRDVINSNSKYIWWMDHPTAGSNWGTSSLVLGATTPGTPVAYASTNYTVTLSGGVDGNTVTDGQLISAYNLFANADLYDISLIPMGKASSTVVTSVIGNVAEYRKDCVVFSTPQNVSDGSIIIGNGSDAVDATNAYRNQLPSSSYAVLDSGFKYQYDRYNDKYRWIPLNGDVAGLCARTDYTDDPWFSPGGFNRGQIKSVVKLAVNPGRTERDNLYKNGVNPVVNFPGQGTVLYGDKTLQAKPSAFDRINVRRLFIVLEKAIAIASKYQLFEFNDSFTRAQFRNLVEPFLRDVQGRRGITDFRVKCDDANNTGEIIDRNEFVADIFIKPARAINFITLNFVAARSAVSFEEIGA
jgi:Phage tail sheath protein subtilisin-like domain/Phage tail sheath C-terminal domain